ncbi:MAG: hypothetical protein NTZ14_03610 [Hyphomicrobiales bacterium]|nr:hypothetical protein [Hyphomicrobiales bacterium]
MFALPITTASAQVAIDDIRLQLFKERSGSLSENIVGSTKSFVNTPSGGGDAGEPAEAILVTLVVTGPKNSKSSDKVARDLASITVTQTAKTGPRVLLKRAYGGFQFGVDGKSHKAFLLENATCAPLEVDVRLGRSRKTVSIPFSCDS